MKYLPYMLLFVFAAGCTSTDPSIRRDMRALETQIGVLESRVQAIENRGAAPARSQAPAQERPASSPAASVTAPSAATVTRAVSAPKAEEDFSELPSVGEVQQALKHAGFYQGEVDGKTGPMTKGAIREFQRVNGLGVDGVMGADTWRLLRPYLDNS